MEKCHAGTEEAPSLTGGKYELIRGIPKEKSTCLYRPMKIARRTWGWGES